ncbi:hypothetical protein GEMRC1_008737 [Eukaryota sp. GEM-RC1]
MEPEPQPEAKHQLEPQPEARLTSPTKSIVWNYFSKDDSKARCSLCLPIITEYTHSKSSGTSTLKKHLDRCHSGWDTGTALPCKQTILNFNVREASSLSSSSLSVSKQNELEELLLTWVREECQSYSSLQAKSFVAILNFFNSTVTGVERHDVAIASFKVCFDTINSKISLTTDLWTSTAGVPFIGVTAHYLADDFTFHNVTLDTLQLPHPHNGEQIADAIYELLEKFDLTQKIMSITHDNATNVISAIAILNDKYHLQIQSKRCAAHILNVIVYSAFPRFHKLLQKVRSFVNHYRRSSFTSQLMNEIATNNYFPTPTKLQIDVVTRWNSTFTMIEGYLKNLQVIDMAISRIGGNVTKYRLFMEKTESLRHLMNFLKKFKEVTQVISGSTYPTLAAAGVCFEDIEEHVATYHLSSPEEETEWSKCIERATFFMWEKLMK